MVLHTFDENQADVASYSMVMRGLKVVGRCLVVRLDTT